MSDLRKRLRRVSSAEADAHVEWTRRGVLGGLAAGTAGCANANRLWLHGGAAITPPTALNSVAYNFGALTLAKNGGVYVGAQDIPNTYGVHVYGLGLLSGGAPTPASWTIQQTGGTVGHWQWETASNVYSAITGSASGAVPDVPGSFPSTPVPTTTGHTAKLNGGPYTFALTYTDSLGATHTGGQITITTSATGFVTGVTVGSFESCKVANQLTSISAWNTAGGTNIYLALGANRGNTRTSWSGFAFTSGNPCTIGWTDSTKPGLLASMEPQGMTYATFSNIVVSAAIPAVATLGSWYPHGGCQNLTFTNCGAQGSQSTMTSDSNTQALKMAGASNCTFTNFFGEWIANGIGEDNGVATTVQSGLAVPPNNNITFNGGYIRHCCNNFIFGGSGANWAFNDFALLSPMRITGTHMDAYQCGNGATPLNWSFTRCIFAEADGNASWQGLFGGTPSGTAFGTYKVFIDDGTGTGTAGTVMTIVTFTNKSPWVPFATIVGTTSSTIAANTQVGYCSSSPNGFYTITNVPQSAATYQLISPSSTPPYWQTASAQLVGSCSVGSGPRILNGTINAGALNQITINSGYTPAVGEYVVGYGGSTSSATSGVAVGVTVTSVSGSGPGAVVTLSGSAAAAVTGNFMAGVPVQVWSAPFINMQVNGFIAAVTDPNAMTFPGLSGSTIKNFTTFKNPSPNPNISTFTGHTVGSSKTLNVDTDVTPTPVSLGSQNTAYRPMSLLGGEPIFPHGSTSSYTTLSPSSGLPTTTGTLNKAGSTVQMTAAQNLSSQSIDASFDVTQAAGPWLQFANTDIAALYPSSSTVSNGFVGYTVQFRIASGGTGSQPSNLTISNVNAINYSNYPTASAVQGLVFAAGNLTSVAITTPYTQAYWAGLTAAQCVTAYKTLATPATGATFVGTVGAGSTSMTVVSGSIPVQGSPINGPGAPLGGATVTSNGVSPMTLSAPWGSAETAQTFGTLLMKPDGTYIGAVDNTGAWNT